MDAIQSNIWVIAGATAVLALVGVVFNKEKRKAAGRALGDLLNKFLGKGNASKLEEIVDDVIEGAKEDNEKKE